MNGRRTLEPAAWHSDSSRRPVSRATVVLATCVVALSIHLLTAEEPESERAEASAPEPPALWSKPARGCNARGKRAALELGRSRTNLASAAGARRAFSARDGVAAVLLYEEAAACFRVAGQPQAAGELQAVAAGLRSEVEEDFRTHCARLQHALDVEDWKTVRQQVRVLRDFIPRSPGQYASWLSSLERRARLVRGSEEP